MKEEKYHICAEGADGYDIDVWRRELVTAKSFWLWKHQSCS